MPIEYLIYAKEDAVLTFNLAHSLHCAFIFENYASVYGSTECLPIYPQPDLGLLWRQVYCQFPKGQMHWHGWVLPSWVSKWWSNTSGLQIPMLKKYFKQKRKLQKLKQ